MMKAKTYRRPRAHREPWIARLRRRRWSAFAAVLVPPLAAIWLTGTVGPGGAATPAAPSVATTEPVATAPPVAPSELEVARLETERLDGMLRNAAAELEGFEREHAGAPDVAGESDSQAAEQAERERKDSERQIAAADARRAELDRGLRDIERDAAEYDFAPDEPVTSEGLAALQTQWALLRGRYGHDHAAAVELGEQVRESQERVRQRLDAATNEIDQAQAELERVERMYPIDHPDVVRQAHLVSALESRYASVRVKGLTSSELAYLEGLARERVEIDGKIEELRERLVAIETSIADRQALAAQAPILAERLAALRAQHADVRSRYLAAYDRKAALEARFAAQLANEAGTPTITTIDANRPLVTRPALIVFLGVALGLATALIVVAALERFDRRILGASAMRRVQGSAPLAEIPFIEFRADRELAAIG